MVVGSTTATGFGGRDGCKGALDLCGDLGTLFAFSPSGPEPLAAVCDSFFASPVFRAHYGELDYVDAYGNKSYQISPAWQSGLSNGAVVGEVIGLIINGYLTDQFGYHKTMVCTLVWMSLTIFLAFFAVDIVMLLVAQILCGISWGSKSSSPLKRYFKRLTYV